jgi:DNA polymerase-1
LNLQQIPNDALFREAFTSPENKLLSTADYSSQEARIMADKAEDPNYINFFLNGDGDIHSFVSSVMFSAAFGRPFTVSKTENKEYRQKGKILNFFVSFGGSAYTLSKTLKVEMVEAQQLIDAFYQGFPLLKTMFTKDKEFALKHGYIRTNNVTNRIRFFPGHSEYKKLIAKGYWNLNTEDLSKLGSIKGAIERRAQNSPIQGTAGDVTKTALVLLRNELLNNNILPFKDASVKMVNVIHDELVIEADIDKINLWSKKQKECMEKAASFYLTKLPIPAEPNIQNHWAH